MDLRNNAIGISTFDWLSANGFVSNTGHFFREMAVIRLEILLLHGDLWIINNLNPDGGVGPNSTLVHSNQ